MMNPFESTRSLDGRQPREAWVDTMQSFSLRRIAEIAIAVPLCAALLVWFLWDCLRERFDWRAADRAATFACDCILFTALFYLSWSLMVAWAGGDLGAVVR